MLNIKKITSSIFAIGLVTIGLSPIAHADKSLSFSVEAVTPKTQVNKKVSYFDIKTEPGSEQDIEVKLKNINNREVVVNLGINSAKTNTNGVVEYAKTDIKNDKTLKYDLSKLVTGPETIKLPAKSEKKVKLHVKGPKDNFDGVIAGGLNFSEKETKDKTKETEDKEQQSIALENKFAFNLAIVMHPGKDTEKPDLKLNDVFADTLNYRNVISLNLQNPGAAYLSNLKTDIEIFKKGSKEPQYTTHKQDMQMAPNTNFNLPVNLEETKLIPGTYVAKVVAHGQKSPEGKYISGEDEQGKVIRYDHKWEFEKEFKIKFMEASRLNSQNIVKEKDNTLWYILLIALLLIILLLVGLYLMKRNKDMKRKLAEAESKNEA